LEETDVPKFGNMVAGAALAAADLNAMGGAWTSYSTSWGGITVGNGTSTAAHVQIGRTTFWRARFNFGTTSAVTGAVTVAVPFALRDSSELGVYQVRLLDSGTAWYFGTLGPSTTTVATVTVLNSSGTYVGESALSSTVPHTWANGDSIIIAGVYEAAS
jgi:hypothetical protein